MSMPWEELERPGPDSVVVGDIELRPGSRVKLHPKAGGDILDLALDGRTAVVEAIEQSIEGELTVAVVVEDDPGRELGYARQPGHRFFFSPDEVEPSVGATSERHRRDAQILVAGIGNVFLGDDGFGVALAARLARLDLPPGVEVVDFGIRGMDLAFAMQDGYDAVVLLDATPRGEAPGTLYAIEVQEEEEADVALDAHGMDPAKVLGLVRATGGRIPPTFLVGCEPLTRMTPEDEDLVADLSQPVRAALEPAVTLTESLLEDITRQTHDQEVTRR